MYVLKMHHVCTIGTLLGRDRKRAKGNYILTASLGSGQYVATCPLSQRERERDLLEIGKYAVCVRGGRERERER